MSAQLDDVLANIAVVGAGGKMGSGIALLLLQEQARLEAERTGAVGSGSLRLTLIDRDEAALDGLRRYLKSQMTKYAEKRINVLRRWYEKRTELVSNEEIIDTFVEGAMALVHRATSLRAAHDATLLFEAIPENLELKAETLQTLKSIVAPDALFFSNTSSIPIGKLSRQTQLEGRLVGFHFYNPPAVQKLLELITAEDSPQELLSLAKELAKRLGKHIVRSNDVAGFIGNGHFLREVSFACEQLTSLSSTLGWPKALCTINAITEQFLIRPMGIFQLTDYVGLDIVCSIASIMSQHIPGLTLHVEPIKKLLDHGITGGQYPDGSQKPGLFSYEKMKPVSVVDPTTGDYVSLPELSLEKPPEGHRPWKAMSREPKRAELLDAYFSALRNSSDEGATLALSFLERSAQIAEQLATSGVAENSDAVADVLMHGFYHLYNPLNVVSKELSS